MKGRSPLVSVLIVVITIGFALPVLAVTIDCEADGGGVDCCGLDCALCVCCSHVPQTDLGEVDSCAGGAMDGRIGPEEGAKTRGPFPHDVLHVPRSALVS